MTKSWIVGMMMGMTAGWMGVSHTLCASDVETDLLRRLAAKELVQNGIDSDVRRLIDDRDFDSDLRRWWRSEEIRRAFSPGWSRALPAEKTRILLAYFLVTGQQAKAESLLKISGLEAFLFADEVVADPRNPSEVRNHPTVLQWARDLRTAAAGVIPERVRRYSECAKQWTGQLGSSVRVRDCMVGVLEFGVSPQSVLEQIERAGYVGPSYGVSSTGFLSGNRVEYFTENRHDEDYVRFYQFLYPAKHARAFEAWSGVSAEEFRRRFLAHENVLAPFEPWLGERQAAFELGALKRNQAIFPEIVRAIRSAKHTIFVDVFFVGGTLGVSLAKELIDAAEQRGVRVLLLKDPVNRFAYASEIDPVFNLLMGYSLAFPDRMTVAPSHVFAHRTGLPLYIQKFLPDFLVKGWMESYQALTGKTLGLLPTAKSDHSKTLVIDGAGAWEGSVPVAYVGSKNWTDSSGAMTFDEVARVTGPAAVAIQDSYYWDAWAALKKGGYGRSAMQDSEIDRVLEPFDCLGRKWDGVRTRITRDRIVDAGAIGDGQVVRIGENNIDSSITSALDQNIQAIRAAKRQIIINDQFLYDRRIVEELIDRAESRPQLQIYIMLEPLQKHSGLESEVLGGFPNTLYADLLKYRVSVGSDGRVRMDPRSNIHLKWKFIERHDVFHHEYHMKTISVDGFDPQGGRVTGVSGPALLITGSANKDLMTMKGAFREMQVEIYDGRREGVVAEADRVFWSRWNRAPEEDLDRGGGSVEVDPFRFLLTPELVKQLAQSLHGQELKSHEFLNLVRNWVHFAYDLEN